MAPFPQPPPDVSRPDSSLPASPHTSLPVSLSTDSILDDYERSTCFTYVSLAGHPHHRQRLRPHGQEQGQTQEQEQEQKQRQRQRQGCDYPSPCTFPPDQANACQRSEPSLHHEQIQQKPSLVSMQEQRALNSYQCKEEIGVSTCIPRSPDPGYLEAVYAYFALGHVDQSDVAESHSENDFHSEDEEDDRDRKHGEERYSQRAQYSTTPHTSRDVTAGERRRSRSICGLVSSETPLGSPRATEDSALLSRANNATVITPPPLSHSRHSPRRRHRSCVAPNTKEFRTLATIFGWVTTSPSAWTTEPCGQRAEKAEAQTEGQRQYHPDKQPAAFETDDDSDLDGNFPHGAMMEWSASLDSRDSDINDSCLQSPTQDLRVTSNPIELLSDLGNLGLSPSSDRRDYGLPARQCRVAVPPLSNIQYDIQQTLMGPETRLPSLTSTSANVSVAKHRCPLFTPASDSWLNTEPALERSPSRPQPLATDAFVKTGHRHAGQRYSDQSFPPDIMCMNQSISHIPHDPSFKCTDDRVLKSSMLRSQGMDSGYMSLSHSLLSQSAQTLVPGAEQHPIESLNDQTRQTYHQTIGAGICITAGDKKPTIEDVTEPCAAPPIPPLYPEIDARVFDRTADEGPDSIVYAPLVIPKCGSLSGTHELRPIIAATIVKLIEKLTHQYGMDSGFMTDFFLTYRLFMSPVQLCKYLIQRYLWALEQETGSRCVVRVRTFVVFRYWINKHFADDFLTSKSLRFQMGSFLHGMQSHPLVQASARDSRIIRRLNDFFKYQRRFFKSIAEQSLTQERRPEPDPTLEQKGSQEEPQETSLASHTSPSNDDLKAGDVERLAISAVRRNLEPSTVRIGLDVVSGAIHHTVPFKGRLRASTIAGITSKSIAGDQHGIDSSSKPPLSKEARAQSMSRQLSEGGTIITRERRLSTSSIKSSKSGNNWSTKMTMGINKLRQKSEGIYQQFVHPSNASNKSDGKNCVCWTPAYTGITDRHPLNSARSCPTMRPPVTVTSAIQDSGVLQSAHSAHGLSAKKPIKCFKSSLSLGHHASPAVISSPVPSPTRNQFSSVTSRHSRSNSNSSIGYHPNPDCPYHIPCLATASRDMSKKLQRPLDEHAHTTLQEALQDDFADLKNQPLVTRMSDSIPPSPAWQHYPWYISAYYHGPPAAATLYKPFILFYRSQMIAQQLCLLEQYFLEQVSWDELLEMELTKAGRKSRSKCQPSISGYLFQTEGQQNGMEASNERSNMLCMWVASEIVSTHPIEDRVRVIEKFIRIAQKCHQYRNFNSLIQLVMGLGSSHLRGLRRTWSRVGSYEMRVLQDLQDVISPCGNWSVIRKAMNQVGYQETVPENCQSCSLQGLDAALGASGNSNIQEPNPSSLLSMSESVHIKSLHNQVPLEKQGCIPFLGLFVFDLTHIAVSSPWYLPQMDLPEDDKSQDARVSFSVPPTPMGASHPAMAARLQSPDPKDLHELLPTGKLLVHFHRFQLIAKTIKWFMAFQRPSQKYTFPVDGTLYSKCFLLRVLSNDRVRELADTCERE